MVVDADDASETLARRTGANGVIEAEERRHRLAVIEVALGAVETGGEELRMADRGWRIGPQSIYGDLALAEVVSLFASFDEPGAMSRSKPNAILDQRQSR